MPPFFLRTGARMGGPDPARDAAVRLFTSRNSLRFIAAALVLLLGSLALRAQPAPPKQDLRFGIRVTPDGWPALTALLVHAPPSRENPLGVTLSIPAAWASEPDWPGLDAAVAAVAGSGASLHLLAALPHPPDSQEALAYLARVSDHMGEAVSFGVSLDRSRPGAGLPEDAGLRALCLKRLAASARGSRPAVKVYLGDVAEAGALPQDALFAEDLGAYVDGYSATSTDPSGSPPDEFQRSLRARQPSASLWLHLPQVSTPIGAQLLVLASAYRDAPFADVETDHIEEVWRGLLDLRAQIPPRMGPGFATRATALSGAAGHREDLGLIHLLDSESLRQGILIVPTRAGGPKEILTLTVPTEDVGSPQAFPLPAGPASAVSFRADAPAHQTRMEIPYGGGAVLVTFDRLKTGAVGEDSLSVFEVYRVPLEVILARHQAVQLAQDEALHHYRCAATVDYHFKLPASGGSLDVTFVNTFFFEKGAGARWVQNQLLLNGVAWKGKRIPELPVIEPEQVNVLPLALTLGRDYTYMLLRDEEVEGAPCHVVEFLPAPEGKGSLYSGKIWIEKGTFLKKKMSVRQMGLKEPLISSEETDRYRDFEGADGRRYRLLSAVSGQMLFSIAGRNIIAERSIRFEDPEINGPGFGEEIAGAEASDKPMLQETPEGLRILARERDGTRRLETMPKTNRTVAVGGAYTDPSLRYPLPLFGVAYFDYAWKGPQNQFSLFATGVVNTLDLSRVNLFRQVDGRLDAVLFAVPLDDRYYEDGEEVEGQRVKILREVASAGLGWRPWEFIKLAIGADLAYSRYSRSSKTAPGFVLPRSHADGALTLTADFSRWGWSLEADASLHRRSSWEPWGADPLNSRAREARDYVKWNASTSKSLYLPMFQKIALSASWFDGRDLDRFSQYSFTYLGKYKMAGFAGSGLRFDRGGLLHLVYGFNLAEVVRFSLQADVARVQPTRALDPWQNHAGAGLSASVVGPWRTYWTLDVGRAVRSDIPPLKGETTAALVVMKFW
jgi:hypothetical protein